MGSQLCMLVEVAEEAVATKPVVERRRITIELAERVKRLQRKLKIAEAQNVIYRATIDNLAEAEGHVVKQGKEGVLECRHWPACNHACGEKLRELIDEAQGARKEADALRPSTLKGRKAAA